jgi:lipoprotein-anchoring transpeptidase ErfK/SrfK
MTLPVSMRSRPVVRALLVNNSLGASEALAVRETLTRVNQTAIFSPSFNPNDPLTEQYVVQPGDVVNRIAYKYKITGDALVMINGINPNRLLVGQKLKLVKGPFHAVVTKSDFRMDLYLTGPDGKRVYIRSFTVGLGANDGTPPGNFIIKPAGKVPNPAWKNPRTGEFYDRNDPKNPIGEYWLALQGADADNVNTTGYGIHGTTEPQSIGKQMSMGCVRMSDADVELIYKLLVEGQSTVTIVP